jgi:catechol 2,3-dioxygenase-like lactoylglutathione lyase family enzyme
MKTKRRVTGLGGIFFKAKNPKKLQAWYRKHLGLPLDPAWGGWTFEWRDAKAPQKKGCTVWSAFDADTACFKPSKKPFMINYRVANLRRVLAELKREGVWVDPKTEESEFGKFGWVMDGEGNRIELWQPPRAKG